MTLVKAKHHLAPCILVAAPSHHAGIFQQSTIILALHDESGAMGFIVNQPAHIKMHRLLFDLQIHTSITNKEVLVGGPLNEDSGFLLYQHEEDQPLAPGLKISRTVSISPSFELLEKIVQNTDSKDFEFMLGYCGWGPGQLEEELNEGAWLISDFDKKLIKQNSIEQRWQAVYQDLGISPFNLVHVQGGAHA